MVFEIYVHHDREVSVRSDLKGEHRNYCLCYSCKFFKPNDPLNCPIALRVYEVCVEEDLVLPVWECPAFQEAEE